MSEIFSHFIQHFDRYFFINWYRRDRKYQFSDITLNEGLQQTIYELPEHYVDRTDTKNALAGQISA
nr:hypothetical protein [Bacillus siamensis]